jgi:glycosyltransferase involved in cell wall biosynthesis
MSRKPHTPTPPPPPGWPRAARPLRIAFFGWARLAFQGSQGSGYNLSASELATGLALSGHEVLYLASGRRYGLRPSMHISPTETWRGIRCFDLFNSPNISPASYNFRNVRAELHHPRQNRLILAWLDRHRIDLVHIHSLEGFPLSLIAAIRATGRPVIVTPHNYWFVCSQVDLMRQEVGICRDYQGGTHCSACLRSRPPLAARLKRHLGHPFEALVGIEVSGGLRKAAKELPDRLREIRGRQPVEQPNGRDPDPESAAGFDIASPLAQPGRDGLLRHNLHPDARDHARRPVAVAHADDNERFLSADHHLTVLNDYGRRRLAGIDALNHASIVIPPSDFVRRIYVRMGLEPSRSRVVRLGQPHFDQINRRTRRSPFYTTRPWDPLAADRPLRFAFFGAMRPSKGIDVLAAAIPLLARDIRQRAQFHIRAQGNDWPLRKKLSPFPEVSFAGGYDLLQLIGAGQEYDVGILPHVWFENSPLVLLEHLHAGKFVICSRLGGPVEWVRPPQNGLLVTGGRPDEPARAIAQLISGEVPLPSPREVHDATPILQSWPGHVREVESIYLQTLGLQDPVAVEVTPAARQAPPQPVA